MQPIEGRTLGIDLGIASCGWAVIEEDDASGRVVALGVRTFDVPETDKERTPTNQLRRQHRGLRTVLRRRRKRMNEVRRLFKEHGLLSGDGKHALKIPNINPWKVRSDGLERKLNGDELAVALGHIAKHRGFKSNSKRDRGANAPKDSSAMLQQIEHTRQRLGTYRSVGEMFWKDAEYAGRKRNRDGDYSRSILREDQERETRLLFDTQRRLGNTLASEELEAAFAKEAFTQKPLADSENKIGPCPFETGEQRAARRSYSFELFRFLSRLTALRVGREQRPLTAQEIGAACADFGLQKGVSFKRLRKLIRLADTDHFEGIPIEEEGKRDAVARAGDAAAGTWALRSVLGDAFQSLLGTPDKLDRIAFVLSFREDLESIRRGLSQIGLEPLVVEALMSGAREGAFGHFSRAGHISAKACRNLIPHLLQGLVYSDACNEAGYDHAARRAVGADEIANPVARKALSEALKQVRAIVRKYGLPGRIHVELARDVGKSKEERDEIRFGIEKRNKQKDRLREEFQDTVGTEPSGGEDLLRYELWKEQRGRCLYTDQPIHPHAIVASDNSIQVDHILPWSRSGDDSFVNKCLCHARANQEKKGRTPYEWFGQDPARWDSFVERVETVKEMKGRKKRNYLLKDASILEEKFRPRNLNDTRYATRLLADELRRMYPEDGTRRIFSRPGPLTDRLRRGWGIQHLKKGPDGSRVEDDRHHALDALVVAATSESALQRLTRAFQDAERIGAHRDFSRLDPPWPGFVEDARSALMTVFVSRAERRRARGEAHAATIRQIQQVNGSPVVYERKSIGALTLRDLDRIKDPERNAKLVDSLRAWLTDGRPDDRLPLSPKGDPIAKVRVATNKKPDVLVRNGATDRGEMVRVDVFRRKGRKGTWEYYLVPIYPHQVADLTSWPKPPNKAVAAFKEEADWFEMTSEFEFAFSLNPMSFVELEKPDGTFIDGYFRGMHRGTGNISVSDHISNQAMVEGIGPRRLKFLRKFAVDRLGRRGRVRRSGVGAVDK